MPIDTLHPEYQSHFIQWTRARDVLAGEDAIKAAGERYLPRLAGQATDGYLSYVRRASFFNATARTADGYLGLVFRRLPFATLPPPDTAIGGALALFDADADLLGTSFNAYARHIVREVIAVGRAGSLVDWEPAEGRVYVSAYDAEEILNWRVERIDGRNLLTLLVLREQNAGPDRTGADEFDDKPEEQIRVLKLVDRSRVNIAPTDRSPARTREFACVVEIWRKLDGVWAKMETRIPKRLGQPLSILPFVFHGPRHSRATVDKPPLNDVITVNLDHYRLDADYKHGIHFTALPTAWAVGMPAGSAELSIGSQRVWLSENPSTQFGFLEFKGDGLATFERAMDRDERLLAVLGSRLLEPSKRVGETAEAIELRQSGENSVLGNIALNVSDSLTQVLRWAYWWHSTERLPEDITAGQVNIQLNTDFSIKGMTAPELEAVVAAWQAGALSRETMVDLFRRGELLPERGENQNPRAEIRDPN